MISAGFLAFAVAQAVQAAPPAAEDEEIVVVATRPGECRVRLADRTLSNRQLAAHAARWAREGRPLRVVRPRGADYRCMARIAFRLNDFGVRLIHFVERGEQP
jgi:hypothetical protein